jgi:hypothetical protein
MAALKTRNSGQWTESRYFSFIKSALRGASTKWGPMHQCLKRARVGYGEYRCDQCGTIGPPSLPPHIHPVIDPVKGFESWDVLIARLFVEEDGYQALCHKCHSEKSAEENALRKEVRNNNKEQ